MTKQWETENAEVYEVRTLRSSILMILIVHVVIVHVVISPQPTAHLYSDPYTYSFWDSNPFWGGVRKALRVPKAFVFSRT